MSEDSFDKDRATQAVAERLTSEQAAASYGALKRGYGR